MSKITITWFDGSQTHGRDWADAERRLRAAQWSTYPSKLAFRQDMAHRAKVWAGKRPELATVRSREFLRALETAGLCRLSVESTAATKTAGSGDASGARS